MVDWKRQRMDPRIKAALRELEKAVGAISSFSQQKDIRRALHRLADAWEAASEDAIESIRPLPKNKGKPW